MRKRHSLNRKINPNVREWLTSGSVCLGGFTLRVFEMIGQYKKYIRICRSHLYFIARNLLNAPFGRVSYRALEPKIHVRTYVQFRVRSEGRDVSPPRGEIPP